MNTSTQATIGEILSAPWYVIAGLVVMVVAMRVVEKRLKAAGKWPYKGDNHSVNQLIWMSVLVVVAVPVALAVSWLS